MAWSAPPNTSFTVASLLVHRAQRDPARPLITYLRYADGNITERMELSAASLANGAAKAAGLLRDELDVQPGDVVDVDLPLHWQASVWIGALALTGAIARPWQIDSNTLTVIDTARVSDAPGTDVIGVSLAAFGMPCGRNLPNNVIEAAVAARAHPDTFAPFVWPAADDEALQLHGARYSNTQLLTAATLVVQETKLRPGGRLLVSRSDWTIGSLDAWLLLLAVPLVADAAVVLVDNGESPPLIDVSGEAITATYIDRRR